MNATEPASPTMLPTCPESAEQAGLEEDPMYRACADYVLARKNNSPRHPLELLLPVLGAALVQCRHELDRLKEKK